MAGLGTVFVELRLDDKTFKQNLSEELKSTEATAKGIEKIWKYLGDSCDAQYAAQKRSYLNMLTLIEKSTYKTQNDIQRAYADTQAKILALNTQMANPMESLWKNLGIRSAATIEAAKNEIIQSYEAIKAKATLTAQDIVNLEVAKNAKLKALDDELNAVNIANAKKQTEAEAAAAKEQQAQMAGFNAARERYNKANAEYWLSNIKYEKEATATATKEQQEQLIGFNQAREKYNKANSDWWLAKIKDDEKAAKEAEAIEKEQLASYEKYAAMRKKIQSQVAAEQKSTSVQTDPWQSLGVRSTASIEAQKAQVIAAAEKLQADLALIGKKGSQDWINIEKAKNEKIKELDRELLGQREANYAALTRALLRAYAAYYVISSAGMGLKDLFMGGVEEIDKLKTSIIAVAAQITNMQDTTGDIVKNYKHNLEYAEALNVKLMEIDANSFANFNQIILMNRAMNQHGVMLDINKEKQIEAFTALTNTIALMTVGQNQEIQASQEMNALMAGEVNARNRIAVMIDNLIKKQGEYSGGLKELVAEGEKHGDTLERLYPYLIGFAAAAGDISKTWMAVGSSFQTAWSALQRSLFKDFYKDLVDIGQRVAAYVKKNSDEIAATIKNAFNAVKFAIEAAIAIVVLFGAASVASAVKAGDALAWLSLRWELLTQKVTLATSKMTIAWMGFITALVGFSIGQYLSNNFEWARFAGISMVYGILDAWNWLISRIKIGWEYLKAGYNLLTNPAESGKIVKETQARIDAIKASHEKEKEIRHEWRDEQFEANTNKAIEEAKKKAKASVETPNTGGGGGGLDDKAIKDAKKYADEIAELKRTLKGEIDGSDLDDLTKAILRNEEEALKRKDRIDSWKISKKQKNEMYGLVDEAQLAKDTEVIKQAEDKAEKIVEDAAKKYKEIVEGEYDFAATENERAINKIISDAQKKERELTELAAKGRISDEELAANLAKINENKNAAILEKETENAARIAKLNYDLIADIRGWEQEAYKARLNEIETEAARNLKDGADFEKVMARKQAAAEQAYIKMAQASEDFVAGAKAGILDLINTTETMGTAGFNTVQSAIKGTANELAEFCVSGRVDFSSLANSIIKDLIRIQIQEALVKSIGAIMGNMFAPATNAITAMPTMGNVGASTFSVDWSLAPKAYGDAFNGGAAVPFAQGASFYQGIYNNPTTIPMAKGNALIGEAGPEAVMPLKRLNNGRLGVEAESGSSQTNIKVELKNESGTPLKSTKSETTFNGREYVVSVVIDAVNRNAYGLRDVLTGGR